MNGSRRAGKKPAIRLIALFLLVSLGAAVRPLQAADSQAALADRVTALEGELRELKQQLAELRAAQSTAAPAPAPAVAPVIGSSEQVVATTAASAPAVAALPPLSWFGYGELNYSRPADDPTQARFDLGRFVLGAGYRFDERTRLQTELEIEHAVASSEDPGEVEIEQAYLERELGADVRARLGLFLIPSGLLNENHEPTRYYGVFRNFVETAIIPSTWREGGVGLQGNTRGGLRWDVGLTTGFDLSKWDATSTDGAESPLGAIHQELAVARAADLSAYLAANYTGINGLRLGASLFTGNAGQRQPGMQSNRVSLWEGHARWQGAAWDLAGLYARGHIGQTAALNRLLVGNPTLIPEDFFGWYLEAAWRGLAGRALPLTPFLRYERYNTAAGYADIGAGLTPVVQPDRKSITGGVQLEFAPGVIIKADYVDFADGRAGDRFDLGLGYEF